MVLDQTKIQGDSRHEDDIEEELDGNKMFSVKEIKTKWLVLVAIAALAAFVVACGTDETKLVPNNGGVGSQPTETADEKPSDGDQDQLPVDTGYEVVDALAPIESVQILVLESYPEQFVVQIVSGLPSGCATFSRAEVTQEGTDIKIAVYNKVPSPEASAVISCTAIYGIHDENVSLGSDFERGTTYSVHVNDHPAETFTTGSAPLQSLPPVEDDFVVEPAPVEGLEIIIGEDSRGPVTYYAHVLWGLTNGCMKSLEPNIIQSGRNEFDIYALAQAPSGDMACTDDYRVDSAQIELGVVGEGLVSCAVYTVNYGDESVTFQAIAPNVRCADPNLPTATPSPPPASIISDALALELSLEGAGAEVENGGQSNDTSFFNMAPTVLKVNGFAVQVYEFGPGSTADAVSKTVSADDMSFITADGVDVSMMWIAPPHWYTFGNAIVLYVGLDQEIIDLLGSVATQFAGDGVEKTDGSDDTVDSEFTSQLATIEKVSIASTRSIPAQHLVGVTIMLASGCEEFSSIDYKVDGREVHIEVLTQVPTEPVPCILMIGYEDQSINIGSDYESGVEYDVIVNGERQGTFVGG